MEHIEIIALLSHSKKIIELLQRRGIVELSKCEDERIITVNTSSAVSVFDKNRAALQSARDILSGYNPQKAGLLASFTATKKVYEIHEFGKKSAGLEAALKNARTVNDLAKKITDAKSEIARLTVQSDTVSAWSGYDLPLNFKGTGSTAAFLGYIGGKTDTAALKDGLDEKAELTVLGTTRRQTNMFVLCHTSVAQKTGDYLRENGFVSLDISSSLTPAQLANQCQKDIESQQSIINDCTKQLAEMYSCCEDLEFFIDYFDMRREKYTALCNVGITEKTVIISGFVPQKYADALAKEIEDKYSCAVSLYPANEEEEDVPVLLQNSKFSAPVEGITEMYALPGKKDIDPTPVMSFFYYLFFGMMLSDAGYGILMVLGTAFALKKFTLAEKMKKTLKMFMYCGISTVFWGALFGSWFGDIVPVVAREFFGKKVGSLALWFEPLDDPMKLLLFSFILGICHLFLGLVTNFVILWKRGQKWDAVCDVIPVMLTVLGAAPLAAGILVSGIPQIVTKICGYVALAGVALIVLTAGRSSKSIPMRLFGGIYGLYNVATGYLSDILSYSRLLALGLATGSIAGVINLIGVMPGNLVIKAIVLVVVFIVGHIANLAINLLGAYVHTDRLQFVELFSKFYEGGGREFKPLKIKTNYIELREENINE